MLRDGGKLRSRPAALCGAVHQAPNQLPLTFSSGRSRAACTHGCRTPFPYGSSTIDSDRSFSTGLNLMVYARIRNPLYDPLSSRQLDLCA